jgi:two-component system phosphate regulon sensor histidine kinase PhoR
MVCLLIAETADSGGIPSEIRHLLDLLAPYFAMAIDDARRPGDGPWPHARAEVQRPPATDATARIAHDIKNAMTSVSTFMQLLAAKWDNPHFRSSFYPVARDEAMRVNGLVHALLDRGKQGFLKRVAVDLRTVLEHILALKAPLADQRRLRMRIHDHLSLATIRIDPAAIEETLVNLLSNAIEASPDGGRIDIGLKDDRLPSGQPAIRLEIQDSGPGVDNALRETIFAPYMSTKTGDLSSGGTGLGLTIARRHIEAHGGTITVMGSTNGGALFRVLLPLERRRG